mmetsp:Transcript_37125/g.80699  ORF Transcript_37125/g.80699 Transcript_37125/m.80699 type:complete len:86 (+) Transcript_37125:289-546(+)
MLRNSTVTRCMMSLGGCLQQKNTRKNAQPQVLVVAAHRTSLAVKGSEPISRNEGYGSSTENRIDATEAKMKESEEEGMFELIQVG